MSDLIDRQAAINEINKYGSIWMEYTDVMTKDEIAEEALKNAKASMKRIINDLPSEQSEIIRCKDCKWFRKEYGWNCIEYTVCGISPTHHPIRREEDFCSFAERRTDEAD